MQCDFCQDEPGLLLMTNQQTGDTQSIGPDCMAPFLKEMSKTYGVWPNLDELLDAATVEAKARELGIWPEVAAAPPKAAATKAAGRKAASKQPGTIVERVAAVRAGHEPTNYDEVPDALLSKEELAARAAAGHEQLQAATGGQ